MTEKAYRDWERIVRMLRQPRLSPSRLKVYLGDTVCCYCDDRGLYSPHGWGECGDCPLRPTQVCDELYERVYYFALELDGYSRRKALAAAIRIRDTIRAVEAR